MRIALFLAALILTSCLHTVEPETNAPEPQVFSESINLEERQRNFAGTIRSVTPIGADVTQPEDGYRLEGTIVVEGGVHGDALIAIMNETTIRKGEMQWKGFTDLERGQKVEVWFAAYIGRQLGLEHATAWEVTIVE